MTHWARETEFSGWAQLRVTAADRERTLPAVWFSAGLLCGIIPRRGIRWISYTLSSVTVLLCQREPVPLDGIIYAFRSGASPESIRQDFPTLTLEQVYGAITFYLRHKTKSNYLEGAEGQWLNLSSPPTPSGIEGKLARVGEQITSLGER